MGPPGGRRAAGVGGGADVDRQRHAAEEGQAEKRKLPVPQKSPEPPEPIFPAQQLEENLLQTPRKESVLRSLSEVLVRGSLTMINLSQRGLTSDDAPLIKAALRVPTFSLKMMFQDAPGQVRAEGMGE